MKFLENIYGSMADYIVYQLLQMTEGTPYANALHYFLSGVTLIMTLVLLVTYLMGFINNYLPMEKIKGYLERNKSLGLGNLMASIFGAITPFCSCSSIPLFIGMMQARIPLGIALSFLITSPLVNEIAIVIFWSAFGWKITVIYILTGISLGVIGGILLEKLGMAKYVADWVKDLARQEVNNTKADSPKLSFKERWPEIHQTAMTTLKKIGPYVFLGLGIGSFIHGFVPSSFVETYLSSESFWAVPLAVILAIPLYTDAVGILPIITTLIAKGVPMGTAIAFMMGAIGLSLPEFLLLKKVMKTKLVIAFFATIGIGMIISGYLFNILF
ncbi:permease [Aureibacter tunicatorum]|uniref:Permease n=1 Tax=Aureibacter tunicatorum TaxID=866807 RepID=A0AAE4BRM3_9BACT|nr:permease [Aureibacter tunicatorum]MDR6238826.1 hypothetical protein [Aureibacter tunicatorum]BDD05247.1 hypothetical protein AUTU_27300 [Aureibacter tunicatorum]